MIETDFLPLALLGGGLAVFGFGRWEVFAFADVPLAGVFLARFIQSATQRRQPAAT